jgi:hypothetical protein
MHHTVLRCRQSCFWSLGEASEFVEDLAVCAFASVVFELRDAVRSGGRG